MREKEGKLKIKMPDKQEGFKISMRYHSTWTRMVKIPKKEKRKEKEKRKNPQEGPSAERVEYQEI